MNTKLCINCKFYKAGQSATFDTCQHEKAIKGAVREPEFYQCTAMRAGICGSEGRHYEPKDAAGDSPTPLEFWLVQYPSGLLSWYKKKSEADREMLLNAHRKPTLHFVRETL